MYSNVPIVNLDFYILRRKMKNPYMEKINFILDFGRYFLIVIGLITFFVIMGNIKNNDGS